MQLSRLQQIKKIVSYGMVYVLWAICLPLGGWVIYDLRDTILTTISVITAKLSNSTSEVFYANLRLRTADTTSWLLAGVLLVVVIVVIENIYRIGASTGHLWSRFFLVIAVCFSVLGLSGLTNDLMRWIVDAFSWRGLFAPAIYGLLAAFCFWLWSARKIKENPPSGDQAN
jgi:hypothetical protein